jgi:hypothetical protein
MLSVTMTQRSVAKTYIHRININHVQVPHSCGVARGKFSTHLFTSGLFFRETKYIITHIVVMLSVLLVVVLMRT